MDAHAFIGFGPKILVAIQDVNGDTRVYTGIVKAGAISVHYPHEEMRISEYLPPTHIRAGNPLVKLDVEFTAQYQGSDMQTWADIRTPEEIEPPRKAIEE